MKTALTLIVFFTILSISSCGDYLYSNDVSGTTWSVSFDWDSGNNGYEDITFWSDGSTSWGGTWSQSGSTVEWTFGTTVIATYTGVRSGSTMSGTMDNDNGDFGSWTADFVN